MAIMTGQSTTTGFYIPQRVILGFVSFFGFMNLYLVRMGFSIISLSMITPSKDVCNETVTDCPSSFETNNTFDWDDRTRAIILSSFTYGYSLTQILGGRLAELYGGKTVFGTAVVMPAVLGLFIPKGAELSYWAVAVLRFLQGVFQGMSWPSMTAVMSVWIPQDERAKYMGAVMLSASLSIVWVMPLSGFLCDSLTWQWAVYIESTVPIIWGIFWIALIHKTPSTHPRITEPEREYIELSVSEKGTTGGSKSVPWKSIFTSVPFLAIVIIDAGNSIGLALFLYQMPNFMRSVYHYNYLTTGFIAGFPFLSRYLGAVFFSLIADHLIKKKILKVSTTRRIFSIFAITVPAVILGFTIGLGMTRMKVFFILCNAYMFFNGSVASSQLINHSDIAPNYAGTLFGISNTVASLSSFAAIMVSGEILDRYDSSTYTPWRIIFGSCIPVMILGEIFYLIFMRGSPLPWNFTNQPQDEQKTIKNTK